jgi:hypothetical protein
LEIISGANIGAPHASGKLSAAELSPDLAQEVVLSMDKNTKAKLPLPEDTRARHDSQIANLVDAWWTTLSCRAL